MTGRTLVGGGSALDIVMVLHLPIILQFPTVPATIADPVPPREESTTEKGRGASIGDDGDGWDPGRGNGRRGEYDRESDACFVCSAVSCPALSRAIALSGAMNSLTPFYLFLSKDSIWSMRCVLTLSKVHSTSKYAGAAGADQLGSESPRPSPESRTCLRLSAQSPHGRNSASSTESRVPPWLVRDDRREHRGGASRSKGSSS
jgi:hypothetical protein